MHNETRFYCSSAKGQSVGNQRKLTHRALWDTRPDLCPEGTKIKKG
ncbi:hypothetical protein EYF80_063279 [Liparis tanakae]|uniref:Uncharacterized protein n=1 Tax=Liparis tanakae TaxID=230148 RepID=A0A4Z2ECX1_9TELE|nr:hypothetical protein EYF80_063279 [Liparis tanakae]